MPRKWLKKSVKYIILKYQIVYIIILSGMQRLLGYNNQIFSRIKIKPLLVERLYLLNNNYCMFYFSFDHYNPKPEILKAVNIFDEMRMIGREGFFNQMADYL